MLRARSAALLVLSGLEEDEVEEAVSSEASAPVAVASAVPVLSVSAVAVLVVLVRVP